MLFMMVSLDGYFEGPDHSIAWHNVDSEFNEFAIKQLDEIGTLLFGRKTYEFMANYWPTEAGKKDDPIIARIMNDADKVVISRTLKKVEWNNTRLISENIVDEINKLKSETGKDIAIFGSNNLAVSLIQMGLLDKFRIMVNPIVIGKGNALFTGLDSKLNLKLITTKVFKSGNVLLSYFPEKSKTVLPERNTP